MLSLSGVSAVIWFEGINDFSKNGNVSVEAATDALRDGVAAIRKRLPGVRVIGANDHDGAWQCRAARMASPSRTIEAASLERFHPRLGLFDGVIDFDKATVNTRNG